jgi:rod shape-determining protein MreD
VTVLKLGLVCLVALILQLTVFVDVRLGSVAPELLALVAILAARIVGPDRGVNIAFFAGLLWDIYLPTPLGLAAVSFAVCAFVIGSMESGMFHDTRTQAVVLAGVGTVAVVILYALLGALVGEDSLVSRDLVGIALRAGAANSVLALIADPVVRWAVAGPDRADRVRADGASAAG